MHREIGLCVLTLASAVVAAEPDSHAEDVLLKVLALKAGILAESGTNAHAAFLTFWDFDGTILCGDCSEGWQKDGRWVYPGLAQRCIEAGLSGNYRPDTGWKEFWKDYQYMDERSGHWLAYPYIVQMLRGAEEGAVQKVAAEAFQKDFRRYYFTASLKILRGLQKAGVEVHIVSASPELFVRGAAETLDIPLERMYGIRVESREGKLTERLIYPVTWAEGKTERIEQVIAERTRKAPGTPVYVLGGFGNSYSTDGPFLSWIGKRELPGGRRPVVLMINGGDEPPAYAGQFQRVDQVAVVGPVTQ